MKAGYTSALAELVERGSDSPARLLVEVVEVVAQDAKDLQADFDGADSLTGLTTLEEGGVRITGSSTTHVEQATDSGGAGTDITSGLSGPWGDAVGAAVVEWNDTADDELELHQLDARLDPNVSGGGVEVTTWVAQLFRLERVSMDPGSNGQRQVWRLAPVSGQTRVSAVGILSTVEFVFTSETGTPTIGAAPVIDPDVTGEAPPTRRTTIALVWALKGEGEVAGNVAWRTSSGVNQTTSNGHRISRYDFSRVAPDDRIELGDRLYNDGVQFGLPRFALKGKSFSAQTITWTTSPLDLGAAPSSPVALLLEAEEPGDSTVVGEIWNGAGWTEFFDGDVLGQDNSATGGADLSSIAASQTKDVRATLTPNTSATATPTLRRIGMEERTSEVLDELAEVRGYSVTTDPVTLQSSIPTAELVLYRSGTRDFRDFATELLSETFPEALTFRLWWGHTELLNRKDWLHLDDFKIHDVQPTDGAIVVPLVHPLERLRRKIPVRDTVTGERSPITYEAQTLKAVFDDLIDGHIGLPGRLRGPGIEDASTLVSKEIERFGPGVEELDRLHFLDGSTGIASQGRYKTRPMFSATGPVAVFAPEEIDVDSLSAGYPARITDYAVKFGWDKRKDAGRGAWTGEVYASATDAITRLGRAYLEREIDELDDDTARWIPYDTDDPPTSALATTVASRTLEYASGGITLWSWKSHGHPRPWLELGDRVAVPTEDFVGLDPSRAGQPLRGPLWAIVRIVGIHDLEGRSFTGWVQDYSDVLPGAVDIDHLGFADPELEYWNAIFGSDGSLSIRGQLSEDAKSFRAISDASAFQVRAVVAGEALQTPDAEGYFDYELDPASTWDYDDEAFISLVAYEKADGSGSESARVYQLQVVRDPTLLDGRIWVTIDTASETLDVYATAEGAASLFPASLEIWKDDPTIASIQSHSFAASGDTIGPTGSGATAEYAALTDIALPKKGAVRLFGTLTSASGAVTPLFSMGDLDNLPGGSVTTANDYGPNPGLRIAYDDDVAEIVVTVPGGKSKTFAGLSGGGLQTYTVGDTLDDVTTEADLVAGETRTGYKVTLYGAASASGPSLVVYDGDLHGLVPVLDGRIWVEVDTAAETLDVYATVEGPSALFAATLEIWKDDPTGAVLQSHSFAASGDTIGPTGSGATAEYAALTGIALPKKGAVRLFGTITAANGSTTPLFSMGDLDALPGGACTVQDDYTVTPTLRITYDDDVAEIVVTVPGGKSKTFTALSGGGLQTYTVGDTLDDVTTESNLAEGETRTGYKVTLYSATSAGGLSLEVYDGDLHGIQAAESNRLEITGGQWYVAGTILSFQLYGWVTNISPGPDTQSMQVDYNPGTGAVSYTYNFSGAERHGLKQTGGVNPFIVPNDQLAFDVTYTPYTGLNGTGTAGVAITLNTGDALESGAGTAGEARDATIYSGNFLAMSPTFDVQGRTADDEPELILGSSYNGGSQSGSWTPDFENGGSQYVTATGTLSIGAPSNFASGASLLLRVVTGGNTVSFTGVEGPRTSWDEGTIWVTFHSFGGTVALLGASGCLVVLPASFFVEDRLATPVWSTDHPRDKASDDTTIELAVDVVPDATGYKFYGSMTPGFTPAPGNLLQDTASASWDHTGLTEGDTWYYRAIAYNSFVESYKSLEGSAQVLPRIPGAPTITVTSESSTQIDLSLVAGSPDTADDYDIERRGRVCGGSFGSWSTLFAGVAAGVHNDTLVVEGWEYEYRARGNNIAGSSGWSSTDNGFAADTPGTPTGLSVATSGTNPQNELDLTWTKSLTGTNNDVEVWRSTTEFGTYSLVQTQVYTDEDYTDTGLADDATYWYKIRQINDCGQTGSFTSPASGTTVIAPPTDPPTWTVGYPQDDASDDTSILGDFTIVTDAATYEVYYKVGGSMAGDPVTNGTLLQDSAANTFDHDVGASGTTVYYQARAKNAGGTGPWNTEASATSIVRIPGTPTIGTVTFSYGSLQATIPWTPGTPDTATLYRLQYQSRVCGGAFGAWTFLATDTASPYVAAVLEGYEYKYRVRGENTTGDSSYSSESNVITASQAPGVPTGFSATKSGTNPTSEIDLVWTDPATGTLDDIQIYRSSTELGTYSLQDTVAAGTEAWTDTVGDGETWWYKIRGINDCGDSGSYTAADSATTDVAAPTGTANPITLSPKNATHTTVTITWASVLDATDYDVYVSLSTMGADPTVGGTAVGGDTSSSPIDVNVDTLLGAGPDDQVFVNVRGTNAGGNGPWGTEANGYTHRETPGLTATQDVVACPSIEYDLTLDHDNTDSDSRSETIVVERDDGSGYSAISGSPFSAGTTAINDTGASLSTVGYRAKYSSESAYNTKSVSPLCPE